MSLKDLHDMSNLVSKKKRQEELRHESERKDEYDSLTNEIFEQKKQNAKDVVSASGKNFFRKNAGILKVLLLVVTLCLIAFQAFRIIGMKEKKPGFATHKPSYVLVEKDNAESLKQFLDKTMASYAKSGEKGITGLWDDKLPLYVISSSTKKLASVKDIGSLSFKKAIFEKTMSSYMVYYQNENKKGLLLRVHMKSDGSFRLTGIE